jgi:hypothetical protein
MASPIGFTSSIQLFSGALILALLGCSTWSPNFTIAIGLGLLIVAASYFDNFLGGLQRACGALFIWASRSPD